ncbi:protein-L-isoaspartate O-methyltransferase family protein [Nitratireductor soli]|uniref:protein-L-isoaspartate O-methyltransferase family protein n=1 Tax=Nitratireductor soli TaxID=1670619 RepID=UPI00065E8ADF|nr:protein-L-isoaspartate O-methyltransferase [Nitratireductor soli]
MNADFSLQRAKMVEGQLRTTDVTSVPLLDAMGDIPREAFVPGRRKSLSYIDEDLEIASATSEGAARYLMEPSPFAKLIQLADVQSSDVVLDVGSGTGYSAAVLSRLASFVVALECDETLAGSAAETLSELGCVNVAVVGGALENGYADDAPYDVIFVGGAVDAVPEKLLGQLRDGGRLVAVIGEGNAARAHLFIKDDGIVSSRATFNLAVKPLPGFQKAPAFVF